MAEGAPRKCGVWERREGPESGGSWEVMARRAPSGPQHDSGTDGVSSVSQLCVTCTPCELSSSYLGTRHPGSSPRNGRSLGVWCVGRHLDKATSVFTLCVQASICLAIGEVLGGVLPQPEHWGRQEGSRGDFG